MGKVRRTVKAGTARGQPTDQMLHEQVTGVWTATMIEASGRMGDQACRHLHRKRLRTASEMERRVRCCPNRNMVWMPIHAIMPKGEDHVWSKGPEHSCHMADQALRVQLVELAIAIVQAAHMLHAQLLAGTAEFLRTHLAQCPARGRL